MEEIIEQLRIYLSADAEHRGSAVQQIQIGRNGELRVDLVDKVRAAELLSRLLDTSALYPADRASESRPCEDAKELQTILSILTKYEKRKTEEERVREP
jgi:hypothetical protein